MSKNLLDSVPNQKWLEVLHWRELGKAFYLFIYFRERGREGEREGKKHRLVASHMCPDLGPNPQPRNQNDDAQPTEPH